MSPSPEASANAAAEEEGVVLAVPVAPAAPVEAVLVELLAEHHLRLEPHLLRGRLRRTLHLQRPHHLQFLRGSTCT